MLSAWDQELERLTKPYREGRATIMERRARHKKWQAERLLHGVWVDPEKGVFVPMPRRGRDGRTASEAVLADPSGMAVLGPWAGRLGAETAYAARAGAGSMFGFARAPVPFGREVKEAGKWERQRARGQRERFERVDACQRDETVEVFCACCGSHEGSRSARCRTALVCLSCRGKIAEEKRAKVAVNRSAALYQAWKAGLLNPSRRHGRWSEKLVTLTLPMIDGLGVRSRILWMRKAWARFAQHWNRWLRRHPDAQYTDDTFERHRLARWMRHLEWTPGKDGFGHPHVHFWFLGPYIEDRQGGRHDVSDMWRRAIFEAATEVPDLLALIPRMVQENLRGEVSIQPYTEPLHLHADLEPGQYHIDTPARWTRRRTLRALQDFYRASKYAKKRLAGRPSWPLSQALPQRPFVDLREVKGGDGRGALAEVIKYLVKDLVGVPQLELVRGPDEEPIEEPQTVPKVSSVHRGRIRPELYAEVYEAFDGTRTTQGSRGFMSLANRLKTHSFGVYGMSCKACGVIGSWKVVRRAFSLEERSAREVELERRRQEREERREAARIAKCGRLGPPLRVGRGLFDGLEAPRRASG